MMMDELYDYLNCAYGSEKAMYLRDAIEELGVAVGKIMRTLADLFNQFAEINAEKLAQLMKFMEEAASEIEVEDEDDQHDGAAQILTDWLPPQVSLQKLYGQGIDYGGPGPPV